MDKPEDFKIAYMRLPDVEAAFAKRNPRLHDVPAIAESIRLRGFNAPPLVNERDGKLVYGHGRTKGVRWLFENDPDTVPDRLRRDDDGMWLLPVFRGVSFKSKADAEEYLVADNRIGELSSWEPEGLVKILERIRKRGKLAGTGYTSRNVDKLLYEVRKRAGGVQVRDVPTPDLPEEPKTKLGDLWELGPHKVICGDCVALDLSGVLEIAQMVFTDPPYNVALVYNETPEQAAARNRRTDGKVVLNDNMTPEKRALFCQQIAELIIRWSKGCVYVCHASGPDGRVMATALDAAMHWSSSITWVKDRMVFGRAVYQSQQEQIWFGWPKKHDRFFVEDRTLTDVWGFPKPKTSADHPTMKPIELVAQAIEHASQKDQLVIDFFLGSGTTLLAAEQLGRVCQGIELDPAYVDVIVRRWEDLTGREAIHRPGFIDMPKSA